MATLDQRLMEILENIIEVYDAPPPQDRERLLHFDKSGLQWFHHDEWGDERPHVTRDDLDELDGYGLIDIRLSREGNYLVKPTPHGRCAVDELRRERSLAERRQEVDFSWGAVRPFLRAAMDEWERTGAAGTGVPAQEIAAALGRDVDLQLIRAVQQLEADEFVAAEWEAGSEAPVVVRPIGRAFAGTRGWPGADSTAMAERLDDRFRIA